MTIIGKLIQTPDRKVEEWLLPQIWKAIYFLSIAIGALCGAMMCIGLARECATAICDVPLLRILFGFFLGSIFFVIFLVFWIILCRLQYEIGILIFCIFQAQRDTVTELEKIHLSMRQIAQTQLTSSQYCCDRLAEICDAVKEND